MSVVVRDQTIYLFSFWLLVFLVYTLVLGGIWGLCLFPFSYK